MGKGSPLGSAMRQSPHGTLPPCCHPARENSLQLHLASAVSTGSKKAPDTAMAGPGAVQSTPFLGATKAFKGREERGGQNTGGVTPHFPDRQMARRDKVPHSHLPTLPHPCHRAQGRSP